MTTGTQTVFNIRPDRVGRSLTHLCGGALAFNLLMVAGLLALLAWHGLGYFWQKDVELFELDDGTRILGEVHETVSAAADGSSPEQVKVRSGNRDLGGKDFEWIDARRIRSRSKPETAAVLERQEWGNFYGFPVEIRLGEEVLARGPGEVWARFEELQDRKEAQAGRIRDLDRGEIDDLNHELRALRWERNGLALSDRPDDERLREEARVDRRMGEIESRVNELGEMLAALRREHLAEVLVMETASGQRQEIPVGNVVRALRPNSLGAGGRIALYASRVWEFVWDDPRESNTEGGIFPAIFGTVLMVFLMALAVVPFGVLAALYLREYARQGTVVRMVRIAVNNLAGTPSIVFGIFGYGFFVLTVGGAIDAWFYPERLPTPTFGTGGVLWASLTLALLTVPVVIVATEEGLSAVPRIVREGSLALGATKWETLRKVVIPASMPAILTGTILAMARAAGEVAPLMIVGMVTHAPIPLDRHPPFVHLEGKFMHLGYQIYGVGFQSPNVEATKPLVYATALLLIAVVTLINLSAIRLRNRLRRKMAHSGI